MGCLPRCLRTRQPGAQTLMVASPSVLERVASLPWPGIASFRQRILLRGVSTAGRSDACDGRDLLQEEKALSYRNYQTSFRKTQEQVSSRLHHPAGQLALLNPAAASVPVTPLHPYVLPHAAIDFDDASKVQQAVETTGCLVQYRQYGAVCVAVGSKPLGGRFHLHRRADFASDDLVGRSPGERGFARHPPRAGDARHARADVAMGRAL